MSIELTDEQKMLHDSVVRYLQSSYDFDQRQAAATSPLGYSAERWAEFAEMGWLAMLLPETYGGFGFGATELMLISEELGRHLVVEPFLETVVVAGGLLSGGGNQLLAEQYLPAIGEGRLQAAFAHGEPGRRPTLRNIDTTAVPDGDGYRLTGFKTVVHNGDSADIYIVSAAEEDGGGLFVVPADRSGLSRRGYPTYDGRRACELTLDNVRVTDADRLGEPGAAIDVLRPVAAMAQLGGCAEAVGAMDALLRATQDYTSQRQQFGQALSNFQVLRHRMADMYIHLELTRSLLIAAATKLDEVAPDALAVVSALKARTAKAGRFIGQNAIQLHGGIAMTDELNVGHYFKRITVLESWFGNREYHLHQFRKAGQTAG